MPQLPTSTAEEYGAEDEIKDYSQEEEDEGEIDVVNDIKVVCGGDTSSTAMGARTTSVLKDLEHRNVCVGLAGNNLELADNGNPELQPTAIR